MYQNSPTPQLEPESSRFMSAIQPALGSLCSSGSNSSSSAASTTTPTTISAASGTPGSSFTASLANPYFNYSNNQFSSFHHSSNNIGHQSAHHQYNAYNQAYANGTTNIGQNFTENDSYANSQLQYSSGPQAWYPNPSDPRFSSK